MLSSYGDNSNERLNTYEKKTKAFLIIRSPHSYEQVMHFFQMFCTKWNDKWIALAFKLNTLLLKGLEHFRFNTTKNQHVITIFFGRIIYDYGKVKFLANSKSRRHHQMHLNFSRQKVINIAWNFVCVFQNYMLFLKYFGNETHLVCLCIGILSFRYLKN